MSKKSDEDLALAEKKDVLRTFKRLEHRLLIARELNDLEDVLEKNHDAEVAAGKLTRIDPSSLSLGSLTKELPSGNDSNGTAEADSNESDAKNS